jgi:hypothetical protein
LDNVRKYIGDPKQFPLLAGQLMGPIALTGYILAAWRLGADMNWLGEFFISKGLLSKWQVWLALAAATQVAAAQMRRAARARNTATPGA